MEAVVTIGKKGVIVIPKGIREDLGLEEGTKLTIEKRKGEVVLKPIPRLVEMRGIAKKVLAAVDLSKELKKIRAEWENEI